MQEEFLYIITAPNNKIWKKEAIALNPWKRFKRHMGERVFESYKEQMEKLREVDEQIQNWAKDLKFNLSEAKKTFRNHNLIDTVYWLGQINNRLKLITDRGKEVKKLMESQIDEFYREHEMPIEEDYFGQPQEGKLSSAGILENVGRRFLGSHFEKAYGQKIKERNRAVRKLLELTEKTIISILRLVNSLDKARSYGDIEQYLNSLTRISELQNIFEINFKSTYNQHLAEMFQRIKSQKEIEKQKQKEIEERRAKELAKTEVDLPSVEFRESTISDLPKETPIKVSPQTPSPTRIPPLPQIPSLKQKDISPTAFQETQEAPKINGDKTLQSMEKPTLKEGPITEKEEGPPTEVEDIIEPEEGELVTAQHKNFVNNLLKLANSGKRQSVIKELLVYSQQLEYSNPKQAMQMLVLAEGLMNE